MTKTELLEMISNGENSGVEFKSDDPGLTTRNIAEEVVAFANLDGGKILLGVEDDQTISGVQRNQPGEWVINICRDKVEPPIIPYYEEISTDDGTVGIVTIQRGTTKPYAVEHSGHRYYYIRAGDSNRECSREEIIRLGQRAGRLNVDTQPVSGSEYEDLDLDRLEQYFELIREEKSPDSKEEWLELLKNLDFLVEVNDSTVVTLGAMVLFGENPGHFLPQSGVRFLAYRGIEPDYGALIDEQIQGPLVALLDEDKVAGEPMEAGLVEQTLSSLEGYISEEVDISLGRRVETGNVSDALREVLVNALVHRDYSISGTDVEVTVYSDRVEVTSPGRLPNTVTVEGLKEGVRYKRNQLIVDIMSDYNYMEHRGQGIRNKVIPIMQKYNGTEPEFIENRNEFKVVLKL